MSSVSLGLFARVLRSLSRELRAQGKTESIPIPLIEELREVLGKIEQSAEENQSGS